MSIRSRTEKQIVVFPHNGISHHRENKHSTTLCNHRAECRVREARHKTTCVCVFIYTRLRSKRNRGTADPVHPGASLAGREEEWEEARRGGASRFCLSIRCRLPKGRYSSWKWSSCLPLRFGRFSVGPIPPFHRKAESYVYNYGKHKIIRRKESRFCKAALRLVTSGLGAVILKCRHRACYRDYFVRTLALENGRLFQSRWWAWPQEAVLDAAPRGRRSSFSHDLGSKARDLHRRVRISSELETAEDAFFPFTRMSFSG